MGPRHCSVFSSPVVPGGERSGDLVSMGLFFADYLAQKSRGRNIGSSARAWQIEESVGARRGLAGGRRRRAKVGGGLRRRGATAATK